MINFLATQPVQQRSTVLYNRDRHPAGIRALGETLQSHSSNQCVAHLSGGYVHGISEGGDAN